MTPLAVFSALLPRLESVGGQIRSAASNGRGGFLIAVIHPDVNIVLRNGEDTVEILCRKGMFPPTRAHVDVDDIMTVIEGWMKEAGGKCGKDEPRQLRIKSGETVENFRPEELCECGHPWPSHTIRGCQQPPCKCRRFNRSEERATTLRRKRQEWGVDRLPPRRVARPRNKSIRDFIREHRDELDVAIRRQVPNARIDDEERRLWILNDEGLYNWARSEGVKI